MLKSSFLLSCIAALALLAPSSLFAAQNETLTSLTSRQQSIITISAYTANGELPKLKEALNKGLDSGLSINEIKEILVQLYAYTGFPRSLNAIHTLISVLDERQNAGIKDTIGKEASPMPKDLDRNEYGAKTRATLAGQKTIPPATGYQLFTPAIDSFLKEHLFADIFYRDNLDWQSRELATISALAAMSGTASQQRFHQNAAMNMGLQAEQMQAFLLVLEEAVGKELAKISQDVFNAVLASRQK